MYVCFLCRIMLIIIIDCCMWHDQSSNEFRFNRSICGQWLFSFLSFRSYGCFLDWLAEQICRHLVCFTIFFFFAKIQMESPYSNAKCHDFRLSSNIIINGITIMFFFLAIQTGYITGLLTFLLFLYNINQ